MVCESHAWEFAGLVGGSVPRSLRHTLDCDPPESCSNPTLLRCSRCEVQRVVACSTSRASKCKGCAKRYRGRVAQVARSGRRFGREGLFVTVTAPGDRVHRFGGEWCRCTRPGGTDLATWNGSCSERWRNLIREVRRRYGADVEYFRATEAQKRGALHFHVLFRRRAGGPLAIDVEWLRLVAIRLGFGHEVDVQDVAAVRARRRRGEVEGARVGDVFGYVAKYVTKAADSRARVPWRGRRRVVLRVEDEGTLWERRVSGWVPSLEPTYRTWVASRRWGDSMRAVRDAQAHHAFLMARLGEDLDDTLEAAPFRPDLASAVGHSPVPLGVLLSTG